MPLMRSFSAMSIDCKCFTASRKNGEAAFAFREIFFHALYPALQKQINHQGKQRVVFSLLVVPAHEKQQEDNEQVLCA